MLLCIITIINLTDHVQFLTRRLPISLPKQCILSFYFCHFIFQIYFLLISYICFILICNFIYLLLFFVYLLLSVLETYILCSQNLMVDRNSNYWKVIYSHLSLSYPLLPAAVIGKNTVIDFFPVWTLVMFSEDISVVLAVLYTCHECVQILQVNKFESCWNASS